mgnify:FL=1
METYAIKNLSFRYPETGIDVLKDITFSVNEASLSQSAVRQAAEKAHFSDI